MSGSDQQTGADDRPYRSHLRPACLACRRRKSRCKQTVGRPLCFMCEAYGTECAFPEKRQEVRLRNRRPDRRQTARPIQAGLAGFPSGDPLSSGPALPGPPELDRGCPASLPGQFPHVAQDAMHSLVSPGFADLIAAANHVQDGEVDEDNTRIVGPVETSDARVLADYLSAEPMTSWRSVRPGTSSNVLGNAQRPVMFTSVRKRPLGIAPAQSVGAQKCQIVEKMLEPWLGELTHLYFSKVSICFPLLDKASFMQLYEHDRQRISPALLSVLYAHTMVFWKSSPVLVSQKCPDIRFIWNQANEALYSEIYMAPGISTIIAILLNVGGRPTTSIMGNSAELGCAVSLAHSLGLNRDPTNWDIPPQEKLLRMRIWWALIVHDKWSSLAYGTPSHIKRSQYDVPQPQLDHLWHQGMSHQDSAAASIYTALVTLSELLDVYLEHVYDLHATPEDLARILPRLELSLRNWEDCLGDDVRRIILRGTSLHHPGAANLRLAYLAVKLLHRRIELDFEKSAHQTSDPMSNDPASRSNGYVSVRKAAEDIVFLAQELGTQQLADFWLPISAFTFTSATTFLLRCALDSEATPAGLAQTTSVSLAKELLDSLRSHRETMDWDVADICLAQYTGVIERLLASNESASIDMAHVQELVMPNVPDIDQMFPSLWDMFASSSS